MNARETFEHGGLSALPQGKRAELATLFRDLAVAVEVAGEWADLLPARYRAVTRIACRVVARSFRLIAKRFEE